MKTTKVQIGKPVSFIGVTYRNMGEGLFAAVTYKEQWKVTNSAVQVIGKLQELFEWARGNYIDLNKVEGKRKAFISNK